MKFPLENVKISLINADKLVKHYAYVYIFLKRSLKVNSFFAQCWQAGIVENRFKVMSFVLQNISWKAMISANTVLLHLRKDYQAKWIWQSCVHDLKVCV